MNIKKNIHIQKVAGIAGSENHLLTLLPQLKEYGYDPTMLVLADSEDRPESFIEQMQAAGIPTYRISMGSDIDPLLVFQIIHYLIPNYFDLIHTHLFHADIYGTLAARLAGIQAIISTKHGFNPWRAKKLYGFLDRIAASQQQQIINVSKAISEWLVQTEKLPAEKMRVIHNSIDIVKLQLITKNQKELINLSKPIIGTVSRLLHQKGVHVLLDAFAKCLEKHPASFLSNCWGRPGSQSIRRTSPGPWELPKILIF